MHAGLPQVAMDFPEYRKINSRFKIAMLLEDLSIEKIVTTLNSIMENPGCLESMRTEALKAREIYCWQEEEKKLIQFYKNILPIE